MKKLFILILCILTAFTLIACTEKPPMVSGGSDSNSQSGSQSTTQTGSQAGSQSGSQSTGSDNTGDNTQTSYQNWFDDQTAKANTSFLSKYEASEQELYYTLWEDTTKIILKIDITPYELSKIEEAYEDYKRGNSLKADTYRKCNLTITVNGTDYYYEDVGIRMRGNTSRRNFCNQDGTIYSLVHFRFDLTETFDGEEYQQGAWANDIYTTWQDPALRSKRKDRTFATMEKFYYKWNKNYDNTYMREVYANKMFQGYGVLAPHITLASLMLKQNGKMENLGVGGLYETIDKRFIKRNFLPSEQGGDLYKCTYTLSPADLTEAKDYGVETPTQRFTYSLKTNNDRSAPDYQHNKDLKNLINVLKTSKSSTTFKTQLESVIDMDYFTRFEAVNYLLGNPDCIRNNANNYYLYFTPQGLAFLIPYDYDRCLGINYDWNPSGNGMINIEPFSQYGATGRINNPLYTKTILSSGITEYKNMFKDSLAELLETDWFDYQTFVTIYNNYFESYKDLAMPSQAIVNQISGTIDCSLFYFGLGGAAENQYNSTRENISTADYMRLKRITAEKYL